MRFTTLGRYALRAMVDVAAHEADGPVSRGGIVARQGISSHYLAQLLSRLGKAELIGSVMGPGGGYRLLRPAEQITAGDVLRAVDEPLQAVACVGCEPASACPRSETCTTHPLWVRISQEMQRTLDTVTLSDLRGGTLSLDH